jgi:hypothetical protein
VTAPDHDHDSPQHPQHLRGADLDSDGFLVGEIVLPGGLPPEDDEDEDAEHEDEDDELNRVDDIPRWDDALTVADRDGFVLFDPEVPGGFRALTPVERAELTDAVRAGTPAAMTSVSDDERAVEAGVDPAERDPHGDRQGETPEAVEPARQGAPVAAPRPEPVGFVDGEPVFDTEGGVAAWEQWAIENADPAKALDDTHPDDLDALQHHIDELRVRLSGYTWRDGIDRDQALAERREQLGRWNDDDTGADQNDSSDDAQPDDDGHAGRPQCLIYPDDPRWYQ